MVTSKEVIQKALVEEKLITEEDLEPALEKIPTMLTDDTINIYRVKKYFTHSGWKRMIALVSRVKREKSWHCKSCCRDLNDKQLQIGCDVCLEWYHLSCTGKSRPPKTKTWICRHCWTNK